ncbi:hypothetical protein [Bacillus sp. AG4(2022)]|uniref:hypothetical protein n=1 Tax=Bacillus sp. AG4(2022) TaxID=2962594 RepID=UPI0028811C2A|nr:hypothetical protein [Bacillus sp. AG4(2022)]MDT0163595.1 hypothetical protein [Bacillus sp. AG4(2022)]
MRKAWLPVVLSIVFIVAAACGNNGQGPSDIPVEWVNAEVQKDQSKMLKLLNEKSKALDPEDKADNDLVIETYKLTEWKANDDRYFYEVIYEHPEKGRMVTERMEVINTDSGWKRTSYSDLRNFETLIGDLEPEVLKELHK